jgi:hypothetical protein
LESGLLTQQRKGIGMKNLLVSALIVLLLGLSVGGCSNMKSKAVYVPEKVVYSDGLEKKIMELDAQIAILVLPDGNAAVYDKNGEDLKSCTYPSLSREDKSAQPCKGLLKEKEVTSVGTVTILKSVGSGCITIIDRFGNMHEYCW